MKFLPVGLTIRVLFGALCLGSLPWVAQAQSTKPVDPAAMKATAEVTKLLQDFLTFNSDPAQHDRFWAEDLVYTSSAGLVKTKPEIMEGMSAGAKSAAAKPVAPAAAYSAEDVLVRLYGDTAALTFRLVARYPDKTVATFRNSGTLLDRGGRWQVITWQATKEPVGTK